MFVGMIFDYDMQTKIV